MNYWQRPLGILALTLMLFSGVSAQDDLSAALERAQAFDGTTNTDWQPFAYIFPDDPTSAEMMLVPVGAFMMGSTDKQIDAALEQCNTSDPENACERVTFEDEAPAHEQQMTDAYWIDRYEVARAQYDVCVQADACPPPPESRLSTEPDQPVNRVSWLQSRDYCAWRGGRLPTEREWEYAARGVDNLTYPWGNEPDGTRANHCDSLCIERDSYLRFHNAENNDGFAGLAPVGSYDNASWVSALDMSGNIYEWTATIYDPVRFPYPYVPDDGRNDITNEEAMRVLRGGGRINSFVNLRTANRNGVIEPDSTALSFFGLRCARSS